MYGYFKFGLVRLVEVLDLNAHSRLGQEEFFGCPREGLVSGDRLENLKVTEVHGSQEMVSQKY
jgi:hypothetical protein